MKTLMYFLIFGIIGCNQLCLGQNCNTYLQKFQTEYHNETEVSWGKIKYGGSPSFYDKAKFQKVKQYITFYLACKADDIGYDNATLSILRNCIDFVYRDDTNLIIAGEYDEKKALDDGGFPNRYHIIDSNLKTLNEYDAVWNLSYADDAYNKEIYLVKRNNKYGLIDKYGKELVQPKYHEIRPFKDDLAIINENNKIGFIDKYGKETYLKYDGCHDSFSEGFLLVWNGTDYKNWRCGLVDKKGKEVIAPQYEIAGSFSGGLWPVYKDKKWGFVNLKNEIVIPFKYEAIGDDRKYGESGYNKKGVWFYRVQKKYGGKEEYINKKGETFKYWEDVRD